MTDNNKTYTETLTKHLQNMVKLDELEKMTQDLDKELAESQSIMTEIKDIFSSIPNERNRRTRVYNDFRREELFEYYDAIVPKLILPDMTENNADLDVDNIIATMKRYAEDLRKTLHAHMGKAHLQKRNIENVDLVPYASSLDQLHRSLANVQINADDGETNTELEEKLALLCQDVQKFTEMVQAKEKMGDTNQNWKNVQVDNSALSYDTIISKMLSDINEVTYLLKNKN